MSNTGTLVYIKNLLLVKSECAGWIPSSLSSFEAHSCRKDRIPSLSYIIYFSLSLFQTRNFPLRITAHADFSLGKKQLARVRAEDMETDRLKRYYIKSKFHFRRFSNKLFLHQTSCVSSFIYEIYRYENNTNSKAVYSNLIKSGKIYCPI